MTGLQHVFGPVPSRRLGLSLGVDVIPRKLCTLDCIYCELGRTDKRGLRRKEYISPSAILSEVQRAVQEGGIDTITFSGSGEPTLNSGLGTMIRELKSWSPLPIAVITNGTLLFLPEVRQDLLEADIVIPSLNAATPETFERVNRPHPSLVLERIIEGLRQFRAEYRGRLWLEVFLVEGVNDSQEDVLQLRSVIDRIQPDRIQLNTVVRPPSEPSAKRVSPERLEEIRRYLGDVCEVIPDCTPSSDMTRHLTMTGDIPAMVSRRPMTAADIATSIHATMEDVVQQLVLLERKQTVQSYFHAGQRYYVSADRNIAGTRSA